MRRTVLALSLVAGRAFRIEIMRAARSRPRLLRATHLDGTA
jgi:RNA 3'-terminal phosphate cyclase